jgi:O-antigen/teichoic acid export membrane protein
MTEEKASYRQIVKATSIFGGVQVFNIIISVIRSKFVAVLLGPSGMGIAGLLTSTTNFIGSITNLGLKTSAVKNIAAANSTGDLNRVRTVSSVLKRLVWLTGLLGTVVTLILAPWLSELTFGNKDYTVAFLWLSITLLLTQVSTGQLVVLQGMRKLQFLAKANLAGTIAGLLISVPLYYKWGIDGIVPAIILSSIATLIFSWFYSSRLKIEDVKVDRATIITEGGDMAKMGFILSLSGLIEVGASYILRIYISHKGGVDQVGLYNAGFAIINTYVGMVFSAMVTDYFPRLSGVAHDNEKAKNIINQQAEIALLILAPILTVFLTFVNLVVIILYSSRFTSVDSMIHWAALGIFFKASSWPIAYIFIAKGFTKLFFYSELAANIYMLIFNILGYMLGGLEGLGISFFAGYLIYLIQVFTLASYNFGFSFEKAFYKIFGIQFLLGAFCFTAGKLLEVKYLYFVGSLFIILSCFYSFKELDKRIGLRSILIERFKKTDLKK